jgi:hypothetical protein
MKKKLPTKSQRKEIINYINKWRPKLFLHQWNFEVVYHDDPQEICAKIEMKPEYKNASISIHSDIFQNLKKDELEEVIVHELCHCIIQPIIELVGRAAGGVSVTTQELDWQKEQVTQHITRSIL